MRCDLQDRASVARLRHGESDVHPFLVALVEYYGVRTFVETGTQQGNTVEALRRHVERVYSTEIDDECFNRCHERFDGVDNVELVRGSSHEELDWLLHKPLPEPILFWLDAHSPDQPDQVPAELRAIEFYYPNSLVVIDDVAKPAGTAPGYYVVDRRFSFWPPKDWQCLHVAHMDLMILHRGSYRLPEGLR